MLCVGVVLVCIGSESSVVDVSGELLFEDGFDDVEVFEIVEIEVLSEFLELSA